MRAILDNGLETLIYLIAAFVLFFIGKLIYQLVFNKYDIKNELVEKDNLAFAIAHTGYFIGLLLAIGSAIIGPSHGLVTDMIDLFFYGLMGIILLNISVFINDKIILRKFSVYDEIVRDQNAGTGVIEAANAIATGLILMGAISGQGSWLTALLYWFGGQVLIVLTTFIYSWITPYDDLSEIEHKDNIAVGIGFAGAMIAIANLIRHGLSIDHVFWLDSVIDILADVAIGLVFLPIARFVADKILLPGQKLTDEIVNQEKPNVGAALIEAFAYIGGSVLITWCL